MNLDEQRRFFQLEFYSWADRFLQCMTATVIAVLGVVLAQSFFSVGGVDAQFLVYTFGLLTMAVGGQFLIFWARIGRGFRISGITMFLFPWLLLLLAETYVFSDTPWRAKYAFCVNLLPVMAFFTAIHISRTKTARWWLIALSALVVLLSGMTELLLPAADAAPEDVPSVGSVVRSVFASLGGTASIGAALLLVFFSMVVLVFSPRFAVWVRVFAAYMAVLFLLGIAFTRHVGVYFGFFAGCVLASALLVRRRGLRYALWLAIAGCAAVSFFNSDKNVGSLKTVPVSAEIQRNFTDAERRAGTRYLLPYAALEMFKEHPVLGVGSGRFGDEFEKYRTPQWQTDPRTAGSLYLQILAENGILGMLLLCGPLAGLMIYGIVVCRRKPWYADDERAAIRRKMGILDFGSLPEERVALAGTLSGLLAVGVLFAVDYPKNVPGLSIACAVFGGIAAFLMSEERRRMIIYSGARRHFLLPVAFLVPVAALALFLPSFRTEAEFQKGAEALRPLFASAQTGEPSAELSAARLAEAEAHLSSALRKSPGHGDAWNALAEKYVFDCLFDPVNTGKYGVHVWNASEQALECSPKVPVFYRTRALAEMIAGDYAAAAENLERADAMTPFNAPALLLSAEIYRSFPQGVEKASALLDKTFALLPTSGYVENMRALMSFGEEAAGDDSPQGDAVVPEF